jgi:hypothetical protein
VVLHRGRIRITDSESGGTCVRMEFCSALRHAGQSPVNASLAHPAKS